jgi:transposase
VVSARLVPASDPGAAGAVGGCEQAWLVAGDRRRLAGRGKKGGEKVARTLRGTAGSRFHVVVEASGIPLEILLGPGNENERRYLLPLLDALAEVGIQPGELWADRGYASRAHEQALNERQIHSRISQPRRAGDPIPPGQRGREVWRGKKRQVKTRDPQAGQRWPVERTNAWLKALRRIGTRRERKADNYLAFLHLGMIVILTRSFWDELLTPTGGRFGRRIRAGCVLNGEA